MKFCSKTLDVNEIFLPYSLLTKMEPVECESGNGHEDMHRAEGEYTIFGRRLVIVVEWEDFDTETMIYATFRHIDIEAERKKHRKLAELERERNKKLWNEFLDKES